MPAFTGTADQRRDLLAYLSTLNGPAGVGALKEAAATDAAGGDRPGGASGEGRLAEL